MGGGGGGGEGERASEREGGREVDLGEATVATLYTIEE